MYARLVHVQLSMYPGTRERMENLLDDLGSDVQGVQGLEGYTLFVDWDSGECGALLLWERKEDEEVALSQLRDRLEGAKDIMFRGRPTVKLFDVYGHKATRQ